MKITLQNRTIFVLWQHNCFKKVIKLMKDIKGDYVEVLDSVELKNKSTQCTIYDEHNNILGEGISKLMQGDVYDKTEGRKRSLTYAIQDLPREDRMIIWDSYAQTVRDPFNKKVRYDNKRSRNKIQTAGVA